MVKNIPAIERSTEIRFGKHVPDSTDQADNTIVFNASNVLVPTPYSNAVYLSPIRNRPDYTPPEVVLLMYDRNTKEITESGESANALVGGVTLALAVDRANVTSNTITFTGGGHDDNNVAFVTDSNVGISNLLPQHTVSVGSNLYIDEFGSNVLVVSGNVAVLRDMVIDGNLRVNGDTTVIYAENTAIKDAFIELGQNNTSEDTTLDLGVLMHRPDALSNVVIGYREGSDEFAIGYTDAKPTDKIFTPKTDEDINVHVYGLTHVDANIYAHEDLVVDGNVYVSQNVSVTEELTVSGNVYADKDLEVVGNTYVDGNVVAYKDLLVTGNVYVSQNVSVTEELTVSGNVYADKDLEVVGNTYVSGNVVAYKDLLVTGNVYVSQNVSVTEELTVSGNVYADKDLEVVGNTYVSGNVVAYKDLLVTGNVYVSQNVSVIEELTVSGNVYADKDLEVVGNTYVSGNVNVTKQLSVSGNAYVSGNVEVTKALIVSANTHLKGDNVFITHTMDFLDPTTAIVTDQISNVQIRLGQLENVSNAASNPLINQVLAYDNENNEWANCYPDQTILQVKNTSGGPITRGQALHVKGSNGNNIFQVDLADASDPTKMPAIGIAYEDMATNAQGAAVSFGRANGISGMSGYTNGQTLYVASGTPGGLTNIKPYGVDLDQIQNVGVVVNNSAGVMFVTGVGRANDIPNARIITDYNDMQYVYVNSENNDLKKIASENLNIPLTTAVSSSSNSAANAVTLRGVSITSGGGFHGDLVVAGNVTVDTNTLKVDAEANRVGILTASPGQTLDVRGSISTDDYLIHNGDTNTKIGFSGDDTFVVNTNGTEQLKIDTNGNTYVTSNLTVDTNTLHIDSISNRVGILTTLPGQALDVRGAANVGTFTTTTGTVTDGTHSTSKDTGVLVLTQGGLGVEANIHSTNVFATSHIAVGTSATSNTFDVRGTANVGALVTTSTHISDSTAVTSKTTGALQVTGGVGIQGDIHATHANLEDVEADSVTVTDATEATSTTTGALKVTGGVGIQKDLYARDGHFSTDVSVGSLTNKKIPYANASKILTDSQISQEADGTVVISNDVEITGTLLVSGDSFEVSAGELIIQDRIIDIANNNPDHDLDVGILMEHPGHNIGLIHHPEDYFSMGYTQNGYSDTHILRDYSNEFTLNVWGYVTTQNTVTIEHNDLYVKDGLIGVNTDSPLADLHVVGNAFVTSNITTSSNVLITGDAAATSKTTGALQVAGGVGISGDIHATHANLEDVEADSVTVTDTTTSTSITTGALKVAGGVSTQEKLNVGGITKVWDSTAVTSKTDGALVVVGGVGISGDIHATHANLEDVEADSVTVTDSTTSTSTTTGALKVTGGVSTQEKLNVGGVTKIWDSTAVTSKTDGALVVVGGVGISGDIHATHANLEDVEADSVTVTDSTTSTSTTTGALKVTGGVSTQEKLNVGGVTKIWDSTAVTGKTDGALVVVGGVGISGDIHATHANLEDVEADSVTVTDTTSATNKTSGALQVAGGVGVQGALYGAAATFDGVTSVTNATAVTSKTDGALVVTGGVGISGDIHATHANLEDVEADSVTVTDATQATDTLTGALTVAGGISTQTNVHAANVYISGGLITNTAGVTKKTYAYSGTIADTQQPYINVCFTNESFSAKIDAQLIEGDDEISTISLVCCGGNKGGTFPASNIQVGSVQVFGPASTNPWSSTVVGDKTTVALRPSASIDISGEYHIFVEYLTAKSAGAVANVVQDTTEKIVFGY
jgi:cytoskeletal protein CcmA (bactofilin family)